jgi:hypothetical protein
MVKSLRIAVVVVSLGAVWLPSATAATVPGCADPADSALNQYCETIPAPAGGQTPRLGLPSLAATLPARVTRQLEAGSDARRALLTLPAPEHRRPTAPTRAISTATTSTLPLWLMLALIGLALGLIGVAATRWRRGRRPGPPDETPA